MHLIQYVVKVISVEVHLLGKVFPGSRSEVKRKNITVNFFLHKLFILAAACVPCGSKLHIHWNFGRWLLDMLDYWMLHIFWNIWSPEATWLEPPFITKHSLTFYIVYFQVMTTFLLQRICGTALTIGTRRICQKNGIKYSLSINQYWKTHSLFKMNLIKRIFSF